VNILIISHGHPDLSAGGAERAAYSLFEHLRTSPGINRVVFASRALPDQVGHSASMGLFRGRPDEPLVSIPVADWPSLMSCDYDSLRRTVEDLVGWVRPDIVHVHHFAFWSLDLLEILYSLGLKVVFTLHEYMAICQNDGQMIKTDGRLCEAASPMECRYCFPDTSAGMFFLRERIFKGYLSYCDYFIAPSQFLRDRYLSWGLDPEAITTIENPLAPEVLRSASAQFALHEQKQGTGFADEPFAAKARDSGKVRFGYFGQINPFKGLKTLLEAVNSLPPRIRDRIEIGVHGANLDKQNAEFRDHMTELLRKQSDVVTYFGPYDNRYVLDLMASYDWIVVPSIWWENSPLVIQEARLLGKPVLCSRIGGMAEKIVHGRDGLHFEPGNSLDLARKIETVVSLPERAGKDDTEALKRLHATAVMEHVALYHRVLRSELA
jgi:glycosyltransferase involved in cell wall biosynthesis